MSPGGIPGVEILPPSQEVCGHSDVLTPEDSGTDESSGQWAESARPGYGRERVLRSRGIRPDAGELRSDANAWRSQAILRPRSERGRPVIPAAHAPLACRDCHLATLLWPAVKRYYLYQ